MEPQRPLPPAVATTPSTPLVESLTSDAVTAAAAQRDKVTPLSDNLSWASLIKEQHRHLHGAVAANACASSDGTHAPTPTGPPAPAYVSDLRAWKAALDGEAAAARLSAYSTAMHHLATQYWDPAPAPTDTAARAHTSDEGQPSVGKKRPRDEDAVMSHAAASTAEAEAAKAPRHYSDRLQYCLDSTASYFLGEMLAATPSVDRPGSAKAHGAHGKTKKDDFNAAEVRSTASSATPPHTHAHTPPIVIPVREVAYVQLPGVLARVVKPLRRLFFDTHGRMATGEEVRQLLCACTPDGASSASPATASTTAPTSLQGEGEATPVQQVIASQPAAQVVLQESTWRRGRGTAWAAALRYTQRAETESGAPLRPLFVLDVGSCYGPFHGKALPRPPPFHAVPLRVTSIDLAPYADNADSALRETPSPRVWKGDWLDMRFFSEEESSHVNEEGRAFGYAEEGRVRYLVASTPAATPVLEREDDITRKACEETGGEPDASCSALSSSRGNAAQTPRPAPHSAVALRLESYDAIFFCLLLSYMPTPRLRFLACLHACLALKEGGLLVVVSTRTQGSRRRNWMQEWSTCLSTIGLLRVQQSTQEKIVGMAFAKTCPSEKVHDSWRTAEGRTQWIQTMMATAAAENGLRITADDAHDRADI